jgi:AcrR family transcriptional regulator
MVSPRDPARSKENAPIAQSGPEFDEVFDDQVSVDEPEVTGLAMFDVPSLDDGPDLEIVDVSLANDDDEHDVTGHWMGATEILPVKLTESPPVVKGLVAKRRPPKSLRPRRGRPRSVQADREILRAATEILEVKGVGGLSIEEVASRASVGKTTVYRRWSSRGTLALDAFLVAFDGQQSLPDTGTFSGDLRLAFGRWVKAVSGTSAGVMLVGLIAELQQDRTLAAAWQDQVVAPLRAQFSMMLDRAVRRGEIPADTDAGIVLDLVFGACYYRLLHGHRPLNEQFVNQVVDVVTIGVGAKPELGQPLQGHAALDAVTGLDNSGRWARQQDIRTQSTPWLR